MAKRPVKYYVVDAFADSAFKGNPAAVCFLDGDEDERDEPWLQSLAAEFNISETCFLTPIAGSAFPRFRLRWFTPATEVDLCGHATLASAHALFSNGLVNSEIVEFATNSGILTAKRIPDNSEFHGGGEVKEESFFIELDFPVIQTREYSSSDVSMLSKALNGATIVDVKQCTSDIIIAVLPSWESVDELQPRIDEIAKIPGQGIIVTAAAPAGSAYDFCSRYFAPQLGIDEDPVCGSAHCALAHYWSLKLNKCDFLAQQVSRRGGTLRIHLDMETERVQLRGKAITVMEGRILV
ncbi:PREDICTED: uncharacterized protein LOC104816931 [Tarenaya hassleriana]|uniref:uncharacterized protein LOC104816931 n=1 Tax=Tarenaya hassleriana TaxID=28532 RepID=UPI00053C7C99|nr:PREDICTED: uncharacterized protein LOC104816931 [Tarenaya hassleriana]